VPARGPDHDIAPVADSSQLGAAVQRAAPLVIASGSRIAAPPVIAMSSQSSLHVQSQPRYYPAPPVIVSSAAPVPMFPSTSPDLPAPSPTLVNPPTDGSLLHDFQIPPPEFNFPENLSQLIAPSNPSTLVPTQEVSQKKKLRKRKASDTEVVEGETSAKPKKARKQRVKKDAGETIDDTQPKAKKKRKVVKVADDNDEVPSPAKKKRRKTAPPTFDPDADPGEEIDPTVTTMAELCVDNGQGRISSKAVEIQMNHLAWKQQSKERRARMKALAEQKKYGRPEEEEAGDGNGAGTANVADAASAPAESAEIIVGPSEPSEPEPVIADATGSGFDYSQDLTASRFTVQVRIGPNGETIIDEESLTVDRAEEVDTSNYVHVVESDHTKFVNSASYTKKCRGARWSAEETDLFFEVCAHFE
jgi:transcription factor TFIIIB component B''